MFNYRDDIRDARDASVPRTVTIDVRDLRFSLVAALNGEEKLPWHDGETFVAIDEPTLVTINDKLRAESLRCELITATIDDHGEVRLFFSGAPTDLNTTYRDALRFADLLSVEPEKFHEWWKRKGYADVDPTINQNGRNEHFRSSVQIRGSLEKERPFRVLCDVYLNCSPDDVCEIHRVLKPK